MTSSHAAASNAKPGRREAAEKNPYDLMNGTQRFLVATVLSVQDSSFTYPACHNCFSRVIYSTSRYECPRCGYTSKETIHRYKVCLKVAEGHQLYIITVFGRCLDYVFGTTANALQRHIQDTMKTQSKLASDSAQELIFQAVEYCFLGRSFLFGVKVPAGDRDSRCLSSYGSLQHMIAFHISLPNSDSVGCAVLQRFDELLRLCLSGHQSPDRTQSPASRTIQTPDFLSNPESLCDACPEDNQQAVDCWQKSLGLTSSSSSSLCSPAAEASACESNNKPLQLALVDKGPSNNVTSISGDEHIKSCIFSTSTPKTGGGSQKGNNSTLTSQHYRNITGCSPFLPLIDSTDGPSTSKTTYKKEDFVNCTSQDNPSHFADFSSKNVTAGNHQDVAEDWEDFLFSESLSELLTKVEREDAELHYRPRERRFNTVTNLSAARLKSPRDHLFPHNKQTESNAASGRDVPAEEDSKRDDKTNTCRCLLDGYISKSNKSFLSQPRCFRSEETKALARSSEKLSTPPLKSDVLDSPPKIGLSFDSRKNLITQPFGFELNENNCVWEDKSSIVSPAGPSINHHEVQLSCQGEITKLKECRFPEHLLQSSFNTSADLFESSETLCETMVEEAPTMCNISVARDCKSIPGSPPAEGLSQSPDFASIFQSTPVLKQIRRPHPLRLNKNLLNVSSSGTPGLLSSRRAPAKSMRNDLLKKMARSFLESCTAPSCTVNKSSPKSPDLAPFTFHPDERHIKSSKKTSLVARGVISETQRAGETPLMNLNDAGKENNDGRAGRLVFGNEIKTGSESNYSKTVIRSQKDRFIRNYLGLSPLTCTSLPPAASSESNIFPNDWSPELFSEKSSTSQQHESLQRRLF